MSSLFGRLTSCPETDTDRLRRLDEHLDLGDMLSAMRLPVLMGPKYWRAVPTLDKIGVVNDRYYERLARMTPCWLLYSDTQTFIEDIKSMVQFCITEYKLEIRT